MLFTTLSRLFRAVFFLKTILLSSTFLMIIMIDGLKSTYLQTLHKEFEDKQPHIIARFIDQNMTLESIQELSMQLKKLDGRIEAVIPFVYGKDWFSSLGNGFFSSVGYQGEIALIGIDFLSEGIYPIAGSKFLPYGTYQIPKSMLEAEYDMQTDDTHVIFNNALLHSHYPPIVSGGIFTLTDQNFKTFKTKLIGSFEDYSDQPRLYASITMVNKLLKQHILHTEGFYIYLKDLEKVEPVTMLLRTWMMQKEIDMTVSSWLENEKKRRELFLLYNIMSWTIIMMTMLLGMVISLLLLYRAIIAKGRALVILRYLGYFGSKDLMILSTGIVVVSFTIAFVGYYLLLPLVQNWLNLEIFYPWKSTLIVAVFLFGTYMIFMLLTVLGAQRVNFSR